MRKVIYSMMTSLDGFIERTPPRPAGRGGEPGTGSARPPAPRGGSPIQERVGERGVTQHSDPTLLDWVIIDEELHAFANEEAREAGAYLYGRRLYENMAAFWPTADTLPDMPGYVLDFARIWKPKPKIVFSRTLDKVEWNSRLVKGDVAEEVEKLKQEPGAYLTVGGANLAATLIERNLIDEIRLIVQPVVIGSGTPFFPPVTNTINLRLLETITFGSGVVYMRYEVRR